MDRVAFICNRKASCSHSERCGRECNLTCHPEYAANLTKIGDDYVELPRPQQVTQEWVKIGGTNEYLCSFCLSRMRITTAHGKIFRICPICGSFMKSPTDI